LNDDPTAWFEQLYVSAEAGEAEVPWERDEPNPRLVAWADQQRIQGDGRSALVVGSGLGMDAEYVSRLGFETTAFDIAPTAIRVSQERFPRSRVNYVVADLLDPPPEWLGAFAFVLESITVQALPPPLHAEATRRVTELVAPGGTLLVLSAGKGEGEPPADGPPWPLTRGEIEAFAGGELETVRIEELNDPNDPFPRRWRAEFRRPSS
jgi:thiopurine S-methyltransferase